MTCIVGVRDIYNGKNRALLAGESTISNGWAVFPDAVTKVFRLNENLVIGGAGSARGCNILQHHFSPPKRQVDESVDAYVQKRLIEGMRKLFLDMGFATTVNGKETAAVDLLITCEGRLWRIDSAFSAREIRDYVAIGSGGDLALGSLATWEEVVKTRRLKIRERVEIAVKVASKHDAWCGGDIEILESLGKVVVK